MFTNNFYNLFRTLFLPEGNTLIKLTSESGIEYAPYVIRSSSYLPIGSSVFLTMENSYSEPVQFKATTDVTCKMPTVVVGSGNTPPNVNDIAIESKITSGLSGSITIVGSAGKETGGYTLTIVLTNTSDDGITISEIGLRGAVPRSTNAVLNPLLDRTVLDNPVTIPAGSSGTIVYVIEYGLPVPPA